MARRLRLLVPLLATTVIGCAVGAGGVAPASGSAGSCSASLKLGFGPYLEKEPPSANFELRAVVYPACKRQPKGKCVAESKSGGVWKPFETVAVLPSSGRCRFILSLQTPFSPTAVRVRFLPASGFSASKATIVLRNDAAGPFPADLGGASSSGGDQGSGASNGSSGATKIVGIVFLDSAVINGGTARVPAGARIYPAGSTITGATGCQTTPTNGQMYLIFDYSGTPTAGEIDLTAPVSGGGSYPHAPIELDVNPGRTVQFLGTPLPINGTYKLQLQLLGLHPRTLTAAFKLARSC
jgi:hypothetical protein